MGLYQPSIKPKQAMRASACEAKRRRSSSSHSSVEEALAHGVIVGITDRPHGRPHAGFLAPLAERQRRILGGFEWLSQHHDEGVCDDGSKAAFGSIWAVATVITGPTAGRGTR